MRILLGVCGSISAYKSLDIARALVKEGHEVRVILTKGAQNFVVPKVFRYLGCQEVYFGNDDFEYPHKKNDLSGTVLHITLAKWAERVAIAPLSANFLSKISRGEVFDLLSSVLLALPKGIPQLYYPAMNSQMLSHPFTAENFKQLKKLESKFPLFIHPTDSGELACGDEGEGKLPTVEKVVDTIESFNKRTGKTILISTGATKAPLDSVRYLTNSSSGNTGYFLAKAALKRGHKVIVVAGEESTEKLTRLLALPSYELIKVGTNKEMREEIEKHFASADCYISSAAIGDIEFNPLDKKLKKSELKESLSIKKADDILQGILLMRTTSQQVVGFAAETELTEEMVREKFKRKPVDLMIGTNVNNGLTGGELKGFVKENAQYLILEKDHFNSIEMSKKQLADFILQRIES